MGNGAVVTSASVVVASGSYEWFNRSMRCCDEDDHVSLGATWAQNFSKCPLDEFQWGKLFATAAGHGALGCLEFLFQRMESEASALNGTSSSKKQKKLVGALTARAAAAAAQPEALDLVISVFGKKVLKGEHVDESGALPIHLASGAVSSSSSHHHSSANRYRQAWDNDKEARAVACVSSLASACPATLRTATHDGSLPLHVAARAGSQAVCAELIANGADVESMNLRTGQYCWQVAQGNPLVTWLQAARTNPQGAAAATSSNGNSRAKTKRPARTPEEEMERAMMIWNVFFENAAKRSCAPTPSSVPPLRSNDGRSSSSTIQSQSARCDYGRHNAPNYANKAYTARAASARGSSTTDMAEYRRLRADLFGMDSLSISPESSSKDERRKDDSYKRSKRRANANTSTDDEADSGGKWQWEILRDKARSSAQVSPAQKRSIHSPLWVACESEEGDWYWFDASHESNSSDRRIGWTDGNDDDEGEDFFAHAEAFSSTSTTTTTWEEPPEWTLNPWEMRWDDDSNAWFYANGATGEATWELPNASAQQTQHAGAGNDHEAAVDESLGQGWEACWDESAEAWYWYETATGESQWAEDGDILGSAETGRSIGADAVANADAASDEWETCWDEESEAWYFFHAASGESQWADVEDFE